MKKTQLQVINELQYNEDVVILNNPLSAPKLVRKLGFGKERPLTEVYTPKLFYDIISKLTPEHLALFEIGKDTVKLTIHIGEFLGSINSGNSKSLYRHVIDCIDLLQTTQVKWKDGEKESGTAIITHYDYHPNQGKIDVILYKEFVKQVVSVTQNEHFSFLKKYLYRLQNAQAIKLFPFFVSWRNKGMVQMEFETFKRKFGYNSDGYQKFANFKNKVLEPAITEINDKTDLSITYKLLGENLSGIRQRVKGLQFFISEKKSEKEEKPARKELPVLVTETVVMQEVIAPKVLIKKEYLDDIVRVFLIFEPQSTVEHIEYFLSAFDNQKAVLEACLYAESEKKKGIVINNFRGFLVSGIPKGMGAGILEMQKITQEKQQKIEAKKQQEKDRLAQMQQLLHTAESIQTAYKSAINGVMRETATEKEKEMVADILREKSTIYAKRTLDDFRKPMFIGVFMNKFIETYPQRFEVVKQEYVPKYEKIMLEIKQFDSTKYRGLCY